MLIEALTCGTPMLTYRRGSIPELIDDNVTGFICESVESMATAVHRLSEIDRRRCRLTFEERFIVNRMVQDYICVYQ